jgi:ATP-binding cassette subfamily C protein
VFLSGGFRLTASLLPLQSALLTIQSFTPAATSAHRILKASGKRRTTPPEATDLSTSSHPIEPKGPVGVIFDRVSYKYSDANSQAINEVSFAVKPGSQVGLIGPSGAGKSTIADLMCGVLVPTSGAIQLVGEKLSDDRLRTGTNVGYVPQSPGMVSGTIAENVALGETGNQVDRKRVEKSLEDANLKHLILGLPDGIDTDLGNLQDGLSGGQLQRIGLARALYTQPSLLVLDEATSALDADSEEEIRKALEVMKGKLTVVIIAHRLNTIQHVDQVFLIEDGRVKDSGKFQELATRNPSLAKTIKLMTVDKD